MNHLSDNFETIELFIKHLDTVRAAGIVSTQYSTAGEELRDIVRATLIEYISGWARVNLPHLETESLESLMRITRELEGWSMWHDKFPELDNEADFIIWFDNTFIE